MDNVISCGKCGNQYNNKIHPVKCPNCVRKALPVADFDGPEYSPEFDKGRLTGQIQRVYAAMVGGQWRTLSEIEEITGDPQASISAQLRHLKKEKFGSHMLHKRPRGHRSMGLWEYCLHPSECNCSLCVRAA